MLPTPMGVKHTGRCSIHTATHMPAVHGTDVHHIWPQAEGGPSVAGNLVEICVQSHRNVHVLLEEYRRHAGPPPWVVLRTYSPAERDLAAVGWGRISRHAM